MPCGDASWGSGMSILIQQTLQAIFGQPYLLVERSDDLLQRAYRLEPQPEPEPLFTDTELAAHQDDGPLLLRLSPGSALFDAYSKAPGDWPGLLLSTIQPASTVLAHLRRLLIVGFGERRKALLRYYDPRVASYFFRLRRGKQHHLAGTDTPTELARRHLARCRPGPQPVASADPP